MSLYKMELYKICHRKILWIIGGMMLLWLVVWFHVEIITSERIMDENGIPFGYANGWRRFLEFFQFVMMFVSVWLIIALTPLFCEERQMKMCPLIFTAERGKGADIRAKIGAAFTVSLGAFFISFCLTFGVCGLIYGFGGGKMKAGILYPAITSPILKKFSIAAYTGVCYLPKVICAVLILTTMILYISAKWRTTFQTAIVVGMIWFVPVMLEDLFRGGEMNPAYFLVSIQPALLIVTRCVGETWDVYGYQMITIFLLVIAGVYLTGKNWKTLDME